MCIKFLALIRFFSLFLNYGFNFQGLFISISSILWNTWTSSSGIKSKHHSSMGLNKVLLKELPYNLANPLLGIHTEEIRLERDTCTPMLLAGLFTIAGTWKQPRCPSADEWIRKLWYIYTMEYYPAIKKNAFESVLMRWMKLEPIIQSKVSQKEKHQYSILTHIYGI